MLDKYLINCCAPTLASLKSGSLFNCSFSPDRDSVDKVVAEWNDALEGTGIRIRLLRKSEMSALIYVFRSSALQEKLSDPDIKSFLNSLGYDCSLRTTNCDDEGTRIIYECLKQLEHRISNASKSKDAKFPHEIGVFLDYPLHDVKEFMRNEGCGSKITGTWKVYGDEKAAKLRFEKFRKCTEIYNKLWRTGSKSILQLTVAG